MPVIRITDATFDRLKRWAVPLEDTAEDALRRVIEAAEEHLKCTPRRVAPKPGPRKEAEPRRRLLPGVKTPEAAYRWPILEALRELGGRASAAQVLEIVGGKMASTLTEADRQKNKNGTDFRWRNTAQWERVSLIREGLLKPDSPHGTWELSDAGFREAERAEKGGQGS